MSRELKFREVDRAYIAGFFDGEGCIRIKRANKDGHSYYITVQITNTNRRVLEYIQRFYGGKIYTKDKAKGKRRVNYQYYITCRGAIHFLEDIKRYLKEKEPQANLAIIFHMNKSMMTPEIKHQHYAKMKELKRPNENPELIE